MLLESLGEIDATRAPLKLIQRPQPIPASGEILIRVTRCGVCHTLCPFNNPSEGIIHPVVRGTAATTPIFNKFFAEMDRTFGYAHPKSDAELNGWWSRDLKSYRGDVIHGTGQYNW